MAAYFPSAVLADYPCPQLEAAFFSMGLKAEGLCAGHGLLIQVLLLVGIKACPGVELMAQNPGRKLPPQTEVLV